MNIAGALVCAAFALSPAVGAAEINPSIRVPPGWTKVTGAQPNQHAWRRDQELLEYESQSNDERLPLAAYVRDVILPSSNSRGAHVIRNGSTTACAGRLPAWIVVLLLPVQADAQAVVETVVAVSGDRAYVASYARRSGTKARPEAERAIHSLCLSASR